METGTISIKTIATKKCPNGHSTCLSPRCWLTQKSFFVLHDDPESWTEKIKAKDFNEGKKKAERKVPAILFFELNEKTQKLAGEIENAVIAGII